MKNTILFLTLLSFSCTQNNKKEEKEKRTASSNEILKTDSIITLEIHAKPGEQFFFGYTDPLFNFNLMETPEKLKVDSIFKKTIISHKPILLKDIHWKAQNYIYLKPGETYRITQDSLISSFEVKDDHKRTYELNAEKELKKYANKQKTAH